MKLNENPQLGQPQDDNERIHRQVLLQWLRLAAIKVNLLSGGRVAGRDNGATDAPTTGTWSQGDRVENTAPVELGLLGSKYVLDGWVCTVGGTPGTWVQQRRQTGN